MIYTPDFLKPMDKIKQGDMIQLQPAYDRVILLF